MLHSWAQVRSPSSVPYVYLSNLVLARFPHEPCLKTVRGRRRAWTSSERGVGKRSFDNACVMPAWFLAAWVLVGWA